MSFSFFAFGKQILTQNELLKTSTRKFSNFWHEFKNEEKNDHLIRCPRKSHKITTREVVEITQNEGIKGYSEATKQPKALTYQWKLRPPAGTPFRTVSYSHLPTHGLSTAPRQWFKEPPLFATRRLLVFASLIIGNMRNIIIYHIVRSTWG